MNPKRLRSILRLLTAFVLIVITLMVWRNADPTLRFRNLQEKFNADYQNIVYKDSTVFIIIEPKKIIGSITRLKYYQTAFQAFQSEKLKSTHQEEREHTNQLIKQQLLLWQRTQQDPSLYNIGEPMRRILQNVDVPLQNRLQQIENYLQLSEEYYAAAKLNLIHPDATKISSAIQQQLQTLRFLQKELPDSVRNANLQKLQRVAFLTSTKSATLAVKDYLAFCRSILFEYQDSAFQKQQ